MAGKIFPLSLKKSGEMHPGITKAQDSKNSDNSNTFIFHDFVPKYHRITESQNVQGWKGPLWVI